MVDLAYILYDDRYRSKVLVSNTPPYIKVSNNSYIPDYMMDLVYNWYDDRYQSEVLFSNTLIHTYDTEVKVTDLERLCQSFV